MRVRKTTLWTLSLLAALCLPAAAPTARAAVGSSGCASTSPYSPGSDTVETLVSDGVTRTYRLHEPAGYVDGTVTQLAANLAGSGMTALDEEVMSRMSAAADITPTAVLYLQGISGTFQTVGMTDVDYIDAAISQTESLLCIDTSRVGLTGMSLGGEMAYHVVCEGDPRFSVFAPVAAKFPYAPFQCGLDHPLPLLAFNGGLDPIISYWQYPSIPYTVAEWAQYLDGCAAGTTSTSYADITTTTWTGCPAALPVELVSCADCGHTWNGGTPDPALGYMTTADSASDDILNLIRNNPLMGVARPRNRR